MTCRQCSDPDPTIQWCSTKRKPAGWKRYTKVRDRAFGRALREGDPCYAAFIYAQCDAFFAAARRQRARRREAGEPPPPPFYKNLRGQRGLVGGDPDWAGVEAEVGAWSMTTSSLISLSRADECFAEEGFRVEGVRPDGRDYYTPVASDVVRVDSSEADELATHEVLYGSEPTVAQLPPNSLVELKEVREPGEWEAPNGLFPQRKLYVVRATYRPPRGGAKRRAPPTGPPTSAGGSTAAP